MNYPLGIVGSCYPNRQSMRNVKLFIFLIIILVRARLLVVIFIVNATTANWQMAGLLE
jgi:hypothetical protein